MPDGGTGPTPMSSPTGISELLGKDKRAAELIEPQQLGTLTLSFGDEAKSLQNSLLLV